MSLQNYIVVVGLGKTGFSCVRHLVAAGHNVAVVDSREKPPYLDQLQRQYPAVPHTTGSFSSPWFERASELVVSPGVSLHEPALDQCLARGVPAIGDIELLARVAKAPTVAITGSNGKSTVTTLVGLMAAEAGLKVGVGGNLGTPALDLLTDEAELYVLELSSFQLETTYSLQAAAAVVLNITPDHMDRYQDLAAYCQAKWRIYDGCKVAVINRDDPLSHSGAKLPRHAYCSQTAFQGVVRFSLQKPTAGEFGYNDAALFYGEKRLLSIDELKIKGRHQVVNALAALALGQAVALPEEAMLNALRNFSGLPHRCQWVRDLNGVGWYNDSKGTNVGATRASIIGVGEEICGKVVLVLGGMGKGADFSPLRAPLAQYVKTAILIGQDAPIIERALQRCCKIIHASSMFGAVRSAQNEAQVGDAVLLSPACASFDMFNNFEHRGQVFMDEVNKI